MSDQENIEELVELDQKDIQPMVRQNKLPAYYEEYGVFSIFEHAQGYD
jgi:hypothetical protein